MGSNIPFTPAEDYSMEAVNKIAAELSAFKGGQKPKAVSKYVAGALTNFCKEDNRFAEVVYKTVRTLSDCCEQIMQDVGKSISDLEVCRKAVQFYFPNSEVKFLMNVELTGAPPTEEELAKAAPAKPKTDAPKPKAEPKPKPAAPDTMQLTLF